MQENLCLVIALDQKLAEAFQEKVSIEVAKCQANIRYLVVPVEHLKEHSEHALAITLVLDPNVTKLSEVPADLPITDICLANAQITYSRREGEFILITGMPEAYALRSSSPDMIVDYGDKQPEVHLNYDDCISRHRLYIWDRYG